MHDQDRVLLLDATLTVMWAGSAYPPDVVGVSVAYLTREEDISVLARVRAITIDANTPAIAIVRSATGIERWYIVDFQPMTSRDQRGALARFRDLCHHAFELTEAQRACCRLAVTGRGVSWIASHAGYSESATATHLRRARDLLGLSSSTELLRWCQLHHTFLTHYRGSRLLSPSVS